MKRKFKNNSRNAEMKASEVKKLMIAGLLLTSMVCHLFAGDKEKEQKFYYDNKGAIELAESQTICVSDGDSRNLKPGVKYFFDYDANNRVIEKKALKWDAVKNDWVQTYRLNYTYQGDAFSIEYATWNRQKGDFNDFSERLIYTVEANTLIDCSYYKKDRSGKNWNLEYSHRVDMPVSAIRNEIEPTFAGIN